MVKIDVATMMRWARRNIRNGDWHYSCEPILGRLLAWGRDNTARVTITALARDLHIGRDRVVDSLRTMARAGAFEIQRQLLTVAYSFGRRVVRDVNHYVFAASKSRGWTTPVQEKKEAKEQGPCQGQFTGLSPDLSTETPPARRGGLGQRGIARLVVNPALV